MTPEGFEIEQRDGVLVVSSTNNDVSHIAMQEVIDECLQRMRYDNITQFLFDFSGTQFLASACLGLLVTLMKEVEHVRGRVALVNLEDNVRFLFKVTRLDAVFSIYDDIDEAVKSY